MAPGPGARRGLAAYRFFCLTNGAATWVVPLSVTVHGAFPLHPAPVHPANSHPRLGRALSVTAVPTA